MNYRIINTQRLTDIINPENIVSIIEINSLFGKSLVVAIKSGTHIPYHFRQYGDINRGMVICLPLDRYTYHAPSYVAIPKELWDSIIVNTKQALFDSTEERNDSNIADEFIKVTITKKVTW